jgi:hypothetical protein
MASRGYVAKVDQLDQIKIQFDDEANEVEKETMPQIINSKRRTATEGPTNNRREFADRGAYWGDNN